MSTKTPVNIASQRRIPTDEELMALPKDGYKRELLHGEIVMSPAGLEHGRKIMRFAGALTHFVYENQLGELYDGQSGFRMKSQDLLCPDISFVSAERIVTQGEAPQGFFEGAPDLAIEFLSPGDSKKRLNEKLSQYFESGTQLAWVMDPQARTVAVYRGVEPPRILGEGDELCGEEILPGFKLAVSSIFATPRYGR